MAVFRKFCDMLLFYIFFLPTVPLLLTLVLIFWLLPVLLYRSIVWVLARTFRKDLLSFVSGIAGAYVDPDPNKTISNFLVGFVLTGDISSERISQLFQERVLNLKDAKGNFVYLRLQQSVARFMGYAFWKNDPNFLVSNHVRDYDYQGDLRLSQTPDEHEIQRIWLSLAEAPWKTNQSPWEYLVVRNYCHAGTTKPHSLIIFRVDHVYCDYYSLTGLFRVAFRSPFATVKLSGKNTGLSWKQLKSLLTIPYDIFVKMCTNENKKSPLGERHGSSNLCFNYTSTIHVDEIKLIRKNHGVAYNAVILSAINGAIARALSDAGATPPESINLGYGLPLSNHPGGFNVHVTQSTMELPCYAECPKQRLRQTHDIIVEGADSLLQLVFAYFLRFLALAPVPIIWTLQRQILAPSKFLPSYFLTNMPVTTTKENVDGLEIVDIFHGVSVTHGIGLFISCLGINNKQRFFFNMDKSVFGDEASAKKISVYFEEELKAL
ncbi:unnamed protein product [Allacma fusca]|uniref:O-acyltransferase WSD1 C-terminal domain-containing protein n=1 Tax=Allacma fusca TaxID=39272 RepID=A0A8J2L527_9HEXA|nr:unnamed protein product [Allacma fusca]